MEVHEFMNFLDGDAFHCPSCKSILSSDDVEELLIKKMAKMMTSYVTQDYKCTKCGQLATKYLAKYCECKHSFEKVINSNDFIHNINCVYRIAKEHNLKFVEFTALKKLKSFKIL